MHAVSLISVDIPEGVTNVGKGSFYGCKSLRKVKFPTSLTNMDGGHTFDGCIELDDVKLPKDLKSLSDYAFNGCVNLRNISVPPSVTKVRH